MKNKFLLAGFLLFFALILYWIELSPWSSKELAKYNNGYGTFDMKSYNQSEVYEVLDDMQPKGFEIYERYFIGDYLFTVMLGALQIMLILYAYSWLTSKTIRKLLICVPIVRSIADIMENTILLKVILAYPQRYGSLINISERVTSVKISMILVWGVLFVVGIIVKIIKHKVDIFIEKTN